MKKATAGTTPCKNEFICYLPLSQLSKCVQYAYRSKILLSLKMHQQRSISKEDTENQPLRFAFSKIHRTWSFHVVVLQRTAKKCTKIQNARAQLLFCLSILLCGVALVAVVVCLNSLLGAARTPSSLYILGHTALVPPSSPLGLRHTAFLRSKTLV